MITLSPVYDFFFKVQFISLIDVFLFIMNKVGHMGTIQTDNNTIVKDNWHHVAFSYNDSNSTLSMYVDGMVRYRNVDLSIATDYISDKVMVIGSNIDGKMDNFKLFNKELQQEEIQYLSQAVNYDTPIQNNICDLRFNETNRVPSVLYNQQNHNTCVAVGNTEYSDGFVIGSKSINTKDGHILLQDYQSINSNELSISVWINMATLGESEQHILFKQDAIDFYIENGKLGLRLGNNEIVLENDIINVTTIPSLDGERFHHNDVLNLSLSSMVSYPASFFADKLSISTWVKRTNENGTILSIHDNVHIKIKNSELIAIIDPQFTKYLSNLESGFFIDKVTAFEGNGLNSFIQGSDRIEFDVSFDIGIKFQPKEVSFNIPFKNYSTDNIIVYGTDANGISHEIMNDYVVFKYANYIYTFIFNTELIFSKIKVVINNPVNIIKIQNISFVGYLGTFELNYDELLKQYQVAYAAFQKTPSDDNRAIMEAANKAKLAATFMLFDGYNKLSISTSFPDITYIMLSHSPNGSGAMTSVNIGLAQIVTISQAGTYNVTIYSQDGRSKSTGDVVVDNVIYGAVHDEETLYVSFQEANVAITVSITNSKQNVNIYGQASIEGTINVYEDGANRTSPLASGTTNESLEFDINFEDSRPDGTYEYYLSIIDASENKLNFTNMSLQAKIFENYIDIDTIEATKYVYVDKTDYRSAIQYFNISRSAYYSLDMQSGRGQGIGSHHYSVGYTRGGNGSKLSADIYLEKGNYVILTNFKGKDEYWKDHGNSLPGGAAAIIKANSYDYVTSESKYSNVVVILAGPGSGGHCSRDNSYQGGHTATSTTGNNLQPFGIKYNDDGNAQIVSFYTDSAEGGAGKSPNPSNNFLGSGHDGYSRTNQGHATLSGEPSPFGGGATQNGHTSFYPGSGGFGFFGGITGGNAQGGGAGSHYWSPTLLKYTTKFDKTPTLTKASGTDTYVKLKELG